MKPTFGAAVERLSGHRLGCFIIIVAVLVHGAQSKQGYLVTAPNRLVLGKAMSVCIAFNENITSVEVEYTLRSFVSGTDGPVRASAHAAYFSRVGGCAALTLSEHTTDSRLVLIVRGNSSDGYSFAGRKIFPVLLMNNQFTLIQTDKPLYKPGQTVRFRLITLTSDLVPVLDQVYNVWVADPSGVRIDQWLNISTEQGISELSFNLASEPPLGAWKISCAIGQRQETATFRVEEYVLPRFEVTIVSPSYVSLHTRFITGEVCARYTYGQPVHGELRLKLTTVCHHCNSRAGYTEPYVVHETINGCHQYNLSVAEPVSREMSIKARVTEQGTGVSIKATDARIRVAHQDIQLKIIGHGKLKPGIEYSGQVKVSRKDGNPSPHQLVQITIKDRSSQALTVTTQLTDAMGSAIFAVPMSRSSDRVYKIEAIAINMSDDSIRGTQLLKPWYSPSRSYLQLVAPRSGKLSCGKMADIELRYTTEAKTNVDLNVQVMGLNNIEFSSHQDTVLDPQELIVWDDESSPQVKRSTDYADRPMFRGKTTVSFRVNSRMSPVAHLLVFYIRPDGEVVADDITLAVKECTSNEVNMSFSKSAIRPGEPVTLQLSAGAGSLCAFGVVDKSVRLMDSSKQLSLKQVHKILERYRLSQHTGYEELGERAYCQQQLQHADPMGNDRKTYLSSSSGRMGRLRPWTSYYSSYNDASHAFREGAAAVLTDLILNTRPCDFRTFNPWYMGGLFWNGMVEGVRGKSIGMRREPLNRLPPPANLLPPPAAVDDDAQVKYEPSVHIRNYFPETWLWDMVLLDEHGKADIKQNMPHTITEWQGSASCVHKEHGFGISPIAAVTAFQPFFVSVELPYSAIRGETVPVAVTVYNYLSECLAVGVILKTAAMFDVKGSRAATMCVCGRDSKTHHYRIVPKIIGDLNITITSKSVSNEKNGTPCPPGATMSSRLGAHDAIVRTLLVEPEGAPREYTLSSYICAKPGAGSVVETYSLALSNDTVPQSARAFVSAISDIMGPSLSNMHSLLRMPWGCGEQNMVGFAPNIFVMQYLEATYQLGDAIKSKAVEYMKSGYQRQLTYSHTDGSYSAFGKADDRGSIWLTAFVVKCFSQARPYIHIDSRNLQTSIQYFRMHQLASGCFPEVGRVLSSYMKGGQASDRNGQATATLTAYIVVALLEAGVSPQDTMLQRAVGCLDTQSVDDPYSLALLGYAYSLYDVGYPRRKEVMDKLKERAIVKDGAMHWERDASAKPKRQSVGTCPQCQRPVSADVEMTAYALLALLRQSDGVPAGLAIARWLSTQRNAYGGFASTQDTVLAIQALAKFASATYTGSSNISIQVTADDGFMKRFTATAENSLVLQSAQLPSLPVKKLEFNISGHGCALVQANVRYNVKSYSLPDSAFITEVNAFRQQKSGQKTCKKQTLSICTQYQGRDGESNMAIIDVKMVTGWLPDKDSLQKLQTNASVQLKRYEISDKTVSLYFRQISSWKKCFQFDIVQEQLVTEAKPGTVATYDYYDTELRHETSYALDSCAAGDDDGSATKTVVSGGNAGDLENSRKQAASTACPVCQQQVDTHMACAANFAYKVRAATTVPPILLVEADLKRHTKDTLINVTASYVIDDQCSCLPLKNAGPAAHLLLLYETDVLANRQNQKATFDMGMNKTVVFALMPASETSLWSTIKRCNNPK